MWFRAVGLREKLCVKCSRFELHVCEEERGFRADALLQSLPFSHWAPSLLKISVCFNLLKATNASSNSDNECYDRLYEAEAPRSERSRHKQRGWSKTIPPFTIFFLFLKGRVVGLLKWAHVFPSSWRSKHPVIPESRRHPQQFLYLGSRNNNSFHNGDNSRQLQKIEEEKHGVGMGGGRESIDFTCVVQHKGLHNLDPFLPLSIYLHLSFLPRFLSLTTLPNSFWLI